MISLLSVTILSALMWLTAKRILKNSQSRLPYPPGPAPKPVIGNTLDFPILNAAQKYLEWSRKYDSGIIHIEALGKHIIIINTVEVADDLLEKRANIYSDRPVIPLIKLFGWEINMALFGYNDQWRMHRKICQQNFRKGAVAQYYPLQTQKVHEMLQNLLERPEDFEDHNKTLSIAIPLSSMYGYEASSLDDPCIKAADESTTIGSTLMLPGGNFIDIIPALARVPAWVPGTKTVRAAAYVRQRTEDMKRIPTDFVRSQFDKGLAIPSLVTNMLERKFTEGVSPEEEQAVQNIAYTVFSAASDTTIAVTKAFFCFMAKHPEAQKKAQEEIDRVVGSKRLPDFSDRGSMPYIEAIYREVLRVAAPLPLCVPHATSEDDHYKGYLIPKGSTIFVNIWGMTHDENRYPDAFAFKPERFLDEYGNLNDDNRILAYGFGRRVCVGKHVGSATVWFTMVSVLACFNIEKAKDQNGNYIEIDDEYEEFGLLRHKAKYQCSFEVRSPEARQLILNTLVV